MSMQLCIPVGVIPGMFVIFSLIWFPDAQLDSLEDLKRLDFSDSRTLVDFVLKTEWTVDTK